MEERRTVLTTCTRDCPDTCGVIAHVTCGRLVGLAGARNHEITGPFLCRKAVNILARVYSPERVIMPRVKVDGKWQDIPWDAALNIVSDKIKENVINHGSLSILHYQGDGSLSALKMLNKRFFNLLGGVTEAGGSLGGGSGIAGQLQDFGYRAAHDPHDLKNSRLIILWGRNPAITNMHLIPILRLAQSRGCRIILIDPVATDTKKFCDLHIKPKPGMDGYLALGIAKTLIANNRVEMSFINDHTNNFEKFKELVEQFDMEALSKLSGVPIDDIELVAKLYSEIKPGAIVCGWGLQRYQWGAETFRLIDAIAAMTGNIGVAGGGVSHGKDETEFFDQSVKGREFASHSRRIAKPLLAEAIQQLTDPPIRMAFINGANPACQSPNAKKVQEALQSIDFVVVFEQFMTDTAELADIVLPTTTFLEETDVVASYWHNVIGAVNPAIEPVGEARSDFQIYQALAERVGIGKHMSGTPDEWLGKILSPLKSEKITLEGLREEHKKLQAAAAVPFEDKVFKTKSGKFEFITGFTKPVMETKAYPLVLLSVHSRFWIHSQMLPSEHDRVTPRVQIHPNTAKKNGLRDGDDIKIISSVGELVATVTIDDAVSAGVLLIEQGHWLKFGQSVNQLTSDIMSEYGDNACFYHTVVRVEKSAA